MKKLVYVCASVLLLAACDKKSDPIQNARVAAKDTGLQKTFVSECAPAPGVAVGTAIASGFQAKTAGYKTSWKFTGDNVSKKVEAYSTTNCEGDPNYQYEETGTYDINKDSKTKSNDGGYPLDIKFSKVTLKIISEEGAKIANGAKLCGVENWPRNKELEVTKASNNVACYGAEYKNGRRDVFTRYRLDNDNKDLYLAGESAVAERDRPAKLENTKFTVR